MSVKRKQSDENTILSSNNDNDDESRKKLKGNIPANDEPNKATNNIEKCIIEISAMNTCIKSLSDNNRLSFEFFNKDCISLSKSLLGKILVRRFNEEIIRTKIVEVEAYLGADDSASHSYKNKITERNKAMFMPAGTAYVYNIYGIYCCFNISSKEPGGGVLIRAVEPLDNFDLIKKNRKILGKKLSNLKLLTTGPSRLCQALNITKELFNQKDLCVNNTNLWLENESKNDNLIDIVASKRINIDYAGEEACNKLYRFYIKDNKYVSVIDKNPVAINALIINDKEANLIENSN